MMSELKYLIGRTDLQPVLGLAYGLAAAIVMCVASAWAMPTADELNQVRPLVKELMAEHSNAYRANKKTAKEVGDAAFGHVNDADGEAAKYLLLKGAINYYSRAREFDKVVDVLEAMQSQIRDLPAAEMESLAVKALNNARAKDNVQRLRSIYRDASIRAKAEKEAESFKAALQKNGNDTAAMRGLADAYARAGNWQRAIESFAKLGNAAAAFELNPANAKGYDVLKAADFWWNYKANDTAPYRAHAAWLYHRAIDEGLVKGLKKTLLEKRIAEAGGVAKMWAAAFPVRGSAGRTGVKPVPSFNGRDGRSPSSKLYCVIDLSAGPNATKYPVSYLSSEPNGGWKDEYKTTKLVLRRIEPGTFIMGEDQKDESHRVTLTKPFYIGVFEVTQKQYELVMGNNPSKCRGNMRPVDNVSYNMIRGAEQGVKSPSSSSVDKDSFLGCVRERTRIDTLDLPTEAQWEYACRSGTKSVYNNGGDTEDDLKQLAMYGDAKCKKHHVKVGSYRANALGLYDMHGNVWEWCLDWSGSLSFGTDPIGPASGSTRVQRGGCWVDSAQNCRSSSRYNCRPSGRYARHGFRLAFRIEQ